MNGKPNMPDDPDMMDMPGMPMGGAPQQRPQPPEELHLAYYEIFMFLFVVAFIFKAYFGKIKNEHIVAKWYNLNKKFYEENYAHIGFETDYNTNAGMPIFKESYNNYKFYATGRVFTKWMLINFDVSII